MKEKVKALLDAYADDLMDLELLQKRAELEAMGDETYPFLCAFFDEYDGPIYKSRIINVFLRVGGDTEKPLKLVLNFLLENTDSSYAATRHAAIQYLGEHGAIQDIKILETLINSDDVQT